MIVTNEFEFDTWMREETNVIDKDDFFEGNMQRGMRLAYLVHRNGGFQVYQWGYIGTHGLFQDQALELLHWDGIMTGMDLAGLPVFDWFQKFYDEYESKAA